MLNRKKYVVSISYGDYMSGTGGTDRVILAQQQIFVNNGIDYLFIYPFTNFTKKIKCRKNYYWGVIINGKRAGIYNTAAIIDIIKRTEYSMFGGFLLHHLKDVNMVEVKKILTVCKAKVYFYIHDYMSVCRGGLVKNDLEFCNMGRLAEGRCSDCKYGDDNSTSVEMNELFLMLSDRLLVVAPSEMAKALWTKYYPQYDKKVVVIPHLIPEGEYLENRTKIADDEAIRVAFVGIQKTIKGWDIWRETVARLKTDNCHYTFYQFGRGKNSIENVVEVEVDFKNKLSDMSDKLRQMQIHAVVLWSVVPETFSYTYYESWAANTFVITNSFSGNIAYQVDINRNGLVGKGKKSLYDILRDEKEFRNRINAFRTRGCVGPKKYAENDKIVDYIEYGMTYTDMHFKRKIIEQIIYHTANEILMIIRKARRMWLVLERK